MVTTRPPKTIVKPTALGPVANTDTKLLIYGLFQKGRVLAQDGVREKEDDEPPLCEPCDGYGFGTECPTCEGQGELKREAQEPKPVGSLEHVSSIIPDLLKHLDDDK